MKTKTTTDLTQLIKNKAEGKLHGEIQDYLNQLTNHKFFNAISEMTVNIQEGDKEEKRRLSGFLWPLNGAAFDMIRAKFMDKYIEQESIEFMDKVEKLQQDVEELLNNQQQEY